MPKLKVTYEIETTSAVPVKHQSGDKTVMGQNGAIYRIPANASVEEVIPAFQPGFYRKSISEAKGYAYFWLTNNESSGYVDVYSLNTSEPEMAFEFTKNWSAIHRLYQRVWFQPVDDLK